MNSIHCAFVHFFFHLTNAACPLWPRVSRKRSGRAGCWGQAHSRHGARPRRAHSGERSGGPASSPPPQWASPAAVSPGCPSPPLVCSARHVHALPRALPLNRGAMCFAELTVGFSSWRPLSQDDSTSLTRGPRRVTLLPRHHDPSGRITCVTFLPVGMQTLYPDPPRFLIPVCMLWPRLLVFWTSI